MTDIIKHSEYRDWLRDLKQQIKKGQIKAALHGRQGKAVKRRHCGLDPQSPENKGMFKVLKLIQYQHDIQERRNVA